MKKALFTMFIFTLAFVGILSSKADAMCYNTSDCNDYYNSHNNGWYGNGSNTWGTTYPTTWGTTYPATWGTSYPVVWGSNYNSYGCSYNCYSYSQQDKPLQNLPLNHVRLFT